MKSKALYIDLPLEIEREREKRELMSDIVALRHSVREDE